MMIQILPGNRLLIDTFGKLLYLSGLDRYRVVPYTSFCVQCLLLYQGRAKFLIILMIPEHCSTHQYLHAIDDQPFLIDSTTFLSQCNRMTRTGLLPLMGRGIPLTKFISPYHHFETTGGAGDEVVISAFST